MSKTYFVNAEQIINEAKKTVALYTFDGIVSKAMIGKDESSNPIINSDSVIKQIEQIENLPALDLKGNVISCGGKNIVFDANCKPGTVTFSTPSNNYEVVTTEISGEIITDEEN
ncbi:MAG: hypothetical protein RCO49_06150 [Rickettsia endosymbiont of Argas persicus]